MDSLTPKPRSAHALVACSSQPKHVDLFILSEEGEVWGVSLHGETKRPWMSLGKPLRRDAVARADRLFARASANGCIQLFIQCCKTGQLWRRQRENNCWSSWAACDPDELDLLPSLDASPEQRFSVLDDGALSFWSHDLNMWQNLGGFIIGGEKHVALNNLSADIFAIWNGNAIMRRSHSSRSLQWQLIDILDGVSNTYTILRPRDLVCLSISHSGLREEVGSDGRVEWIAQGPQGRLIVNLPPQHVAETILSSGPPTSRAQLSGSSTLHFKITSQRVSLSVEGLLTAMRQLPLASGPPHGQSSVIELPWRLLLALESAKNCIHRSKPASTTDGATELWHTRILDSNSAYAAVRPFATLPRDAQFANQTPISDSALSLIATQGAASAHPVNVDRLILSTFGAWFAGSVTYPEVDWTHRMAMGRDYYVKVVTRGVVFPFGHKAAVVKITERRFDGGVAGLHDNFAIVVSEPTLSYGFSSPYERGFIFQRIDIQPRMVAPIDEEVGDSLSMIWPKRNGVAVLFSVRGWAGSEVIDMQLPLLFSDGSRDVDDLIREYAAGPRSVNDRAGAMGQQPNAIVGKFIPLTMKGPQQPLPGSFQQVQSLTFNAVRIPGTSKFHPTISELVVALPAVRSLLGQVTDVRARLSSQLQSTAPEPDVLLDIVEPLTLNFGGLNAGVVAAPNIKVNQISRTNGPQIDHLPKNPTLLFGGTGGRLLGIIPLADVIQSVTSAPTIIWEPPTAKMHWNHRLKNHSGPFRPGNDCRIDLNVELRLPPGGSRQIVTTGSVSDFQLIVPSANDEANALVVLNFKEFRFGSETGRLPTTAFEILSAQFGGKLKFLRKLSQYLPQAGKRGLIVETTASEIRIAYALAIGSVPLAVFTIQNLQLGFGVTLSLVNRPITINFNFGSRAQPFLVTVMGFGGGGYLELGISAGGEGGGLERIVGGIEFGAAVAMDFGVAFGEVHVFGGVVFTKKPPSIEITGYLRIGGTVRVLGLISVSLELTISLTYVPDTNELTGEGKLVIAIDLTFWSSSVEIGCRKSFKGPDLFVLEAAAASPDAAALSIKTALGPDGQSFPWQSYCRAFASE